MWNPIKIEFADRLRGIAALSVLVSHLYGVFWIQRDAVQAFTGVPVLPSHFGVPIYVTVINWFASFNWGAFGVALFFMVSGFVIPFSLTRYDRLAFGVARFVRLVPTYVVGFMVTLGALWLARSYFGEPFGLKLGAISAHLIPGLRDLLGTTNIDGIIWTLEIEVKFYLLCGIALPWIRRGSCLILLVPAAIAVLFFVNLRYGGLLAGDSTLLRLSQIISVNCQFLVFMFLGTVVHMVHRGVWLTELAMFSLGSLIFVLVIMFTNGFQKDYPFVAYSYGAALVVFLAAATWPRIVPGGRIAGFFADISYPLYVIHAVAGYAILLVLLDLDVKPTLALVLVTLGVIGISAIIHRYVEKPTQRLARGFGRRMSEDGSAGSA